MPINRVAHLFRPNVQRQDGPTVALTFHPKCPCGHCKPIIINMSGSDVRELYHTLAVVVADLDSREGGAS